MRRSSSLVIGLFGLIASLLSMPSSVAAGDCTSFAQFGKSAVSLEPYTDADFQKDVPSLKNPQEIDMIGNQTKTGEPAFRVVDAQPGWDANLLKIIQDKGSNIAVFSFAARSSDGTIWRPVIRTTWDLQEDPEKTPITSADLTYLTSQQASTVRQPISRATFRTGISLMRQGLTPGNWGALGIEINVKGCPVQTIYTKRFQVPQFEIKNFNFDNFVDNEVSYVKSPINYLARQECAKSVEALKSAAISASSKSSSWSLPNTQTGNLDLRWKPSGESQCTLHADLLLSPALGDGCLKRMNPGSSNYSYQTLKYPCVVSLDARASTYVQLATFTIAKPSGSSATAVTTCVKGPKVQKISGANAKCPTGYKKK